MHGANMKSAWCFNIIRLSCQSSVLYYHYSSVIHPSAAPSVFSS